MSRTGLVLSCAASAALGATVTAWGMGAARQPEVTAWTCDAKGYIVEPPNAPPEIMTDLLHRNVVLNSYRIKALRGEWVNPARLVKAEGCP